MPPACSELGLLSSIQLWCPRDVLARWLAQKHSAASGEASLCRRVLADRVGSQAVQGHWVRHQVY